MTMTRNHEHEMSDEPTKTSGFGIGELSRVPASTPMDEIEAAQLQPEPRQVMRKCSCGHTVPAAWVMFASLGTSCPDCYDRLSD
jgi:hypothetical protein